MFPLFYRLPRVLLAVVFLFGLYLPVRAQEDASSSSTVDETFTVCALNVDGLPESITLFGFITITLNSDSKGSEGATAIGEYLAEKGYDLLAFSEDFNYHEYIMAELYSLYTAGTWEGSITTSGFFTSLGQYDVDGLEFLWKTGSLSASGETIVSWNESNGYTDDGSDELIDKGYRYYEVTLSGGTLIDVFILHMDAETSDDDIAARESQIAQLVEAIEDLGTPERPKLIMGDTNCRYTRDQLESLFVDALEADGDVRVEDAWVKLCQGGVYPTYGSSALMVSTLGYTEGEVVDKVLYVNPVLGQQIEATSITFDSEGYVDEDGEALGDHIPVAVTFAVYYLSKTLGEATTSISDGAYIAAEDFPGVLTITYAEAMAEDASAYPLSAIKVLDAGGAALLSADGDTVGTATLAASLVDDVPVLTVTFSDYSLTFGEVYTLSVAAGSYGWDDDDDYGKNATISISFTAADIAAGKYYLRLYDADAESVAEYRYMGRGQNWGTRAVTNQYGSPVQVGYDSLETVIYFLDNLNASDGAFLYIADGNRQTVYTDQKGDYRYWLVEESGDVEGAVVIRDGNSGLSTYGHPLCVADGGTLEVAETSDATPAYWVMEALDEHREVMQQREDLFTASAAASAGISVSSREELEGVLADDYMEEDVTSLLTGKTDDSTTELYQDGSNSGAYELPMQTVVFSETVSGLANGLYRLGVHAFFRVSSNDWTNTLYFDYGDAARTSAFLVAGGDSVQLMSVMEEGYATAYGSDSNLPDYLGSDGLYHPNCTGDADSAFGDGYYENDLYVYVSDSTLTFAITKTVDYTPQNWLYYNDFTLTRLVEKPVYWRATTMNDDGEYQYFSRGSNWGSRAGVDELGVPLRIVRDNDGGCTVEFMDGTYGARYLYNTGGRLFTDGTSGIAFTAQTDDDGNIRLYDANGGEQNGQALYIDDNGNISLSASQTATVWEKQTITEHNAYLQQLLDEQASAAASAAGISASTREVLALMLLLCDSTQISLTGTDNAEMFNAGNPGSDTDTGSATTGYAETATGLSPGLYRLSAQAFYRSGAYRIVDTLYNVYGDMARGTSYLVAGDARTPIMSLLDEQHETAYSGDVQLSTGLYVNDGTTGAAAAFEDGLYQNDVYVYVSDDTLALSIVKEIGCPPNNWTYYGNVSLMRFTPATVSVSISSVGWATLYYGAYNLVAPEDVTVYTVSLTESESSNSGYVATLTALSSGTVIPAGVAVILSGEEGTYVFTVSSDEAAEVSSDLSGSDVTYSVSDDEGHYYYQLSLYSDDSDVSTLGFWWQAADGHSYTNAPHKGYLCIAANEDGTASGISIRISDLTAISSVNSEPDVPQGVYSLVGVRLADDPQNLPAGIYIINGKKVLLK